MSYKKDKKYKEALKLFYGANRYILNNRMLPGTPTLPSIVECLVTFTNTSYPDLPVKLPKYIVNFKWAYITLPTVTGTYEDEYNFYTPVRWSIGDFNTNVLLKNSVKANLEFDVEPKTTTRTLSFTNTTYPQFIVDLPDPITAEIGDSVILPTVEGVYRDSDNLRWEPVRWNIGAFGETIGPLHENVTADLVMEQVIGWEPGGVVKYSYVVLDKDTGDIQYSEIETGLQCIETSFVLLPDEPLVIIEPSFVLLPDEPLVIIEPDPQMYDVWIETVDVANNVVVALRSVFTGLTASCANTIVNNAPTYLSRYNGYLNNQGGPYTQSDATAMRDQLQSKIPSGDTSTFGIRAILT